MRVCVFVSHFQAHSLLAFTLLAFCCQDTPLCEHCGRNRVMITRYSEGYGTEVMCILCAPSYFISGDCGVLYRMFYCLIRLCHFFFCAALAFAGSWLSRFQHVIHT